MKLYVLTLEHIHFQTQKGNSLLILYYLGYLWAANGCEREKRAHICWEENTDILYLRYSDMNGL